MTKLFTRLSLMLLVVVSCKPAVLVSSKQLNQNGALPEITIDHISLETDERLQLWTVCDLVYEGEGSMILSGRLTGTNGYKTNFSFDIRHKQVSVKETKIAVGKHTQWRYQGRNMVFKDLKKGEYKLEAQLHVDGFDAYTLNHCELLVKKK
ncbi:hypothetical protein GC194_06055 [bacterium]|nr:hypothetical protein [bacterium]